MASDVPEAYRPFVAVPGGEGPTIGTVGDAVDEVMGLQRNSERLAARYVPQHDGSLDVSGREHSAIGTEREASDGASMIVELANQPAGEGGP